MSEIGKHVLPGTVCRRETEKSIAFERRPPLIAIGESRPRSLLVNKKKKEKRIKQKSKKKKKGKKRAKTIKQATTQRNLEYPRFYFLYYNLNASIRLLPPILPLLFSCCKTDLDYRYEMENTQAVL